MANAAGSAAGSGLVGGLALGPWGALAGAGLGLIKSIFDSENEKKDRITQSITDRYSPWTGMRGKMVEHTNPLGDVAATAAQGAMLGQGLSSAQSQDALNNAIASKLGANGGADAMNAGAVAAAKGGGSALANDAAGLASPVSRYSTSLDANFDPKTAQGALTLALVSNALKNRQMAGLV